eukprot:CAMPEP_0172629656 /NCGR_PEP_ID=MMETSP1068-20121228/169171_1 /TAXON_ID=35684 /ORGANISM="Pseudopedinella elastica, Strain CCMP716" /LENGTH=109 /DNA_ID=CAMNT_0013440261 /DNA_START=430 /DNA_END=756 /DNA_ORIENTATION=-
MTALRLHADLSLRNPFLKTDRTTVVPTRCLSNEDRQAFCPLLRGFLSLALGTQRSFVGSLEDSLEGAAPVFELNVKTLCQPHHALRPLGGLMGNIHRELKARKLLETGH